MITLDDLLTSSGKYPDRAKSPEVTDEVRKNGEELLRRVNALLKELGITNATVSSGFRTSDANKAIPNAAKKSAHMRGMAIDIADPDQKIAKLVRKTQNNQGKKGIMGRHGVMMEKLEKTPTWAHFDFVVRSERPSYEFEP